MNGAAPIRPLEEERILAVTLERARAMAPRLLEEAVGVPIETLGDGYFVANKGPTRVTVRLGRSGPDTRFLVRVEPQTHLQPRVVALVASMVAAFTVLVATIRFLPPGARKVFGLAMPLLVIGTIFGAIALSSKGMKNQALARDLLIHNVFRKIEDAVAEQGVAPNYRVAPGADAVSLPPADGAGAEAEVEAGEPPPSRAARMRA